MTLNSLPRSAANPQGPWEVAKDFHVPEGFVDVSWDQDLNPSVQCIATELCVYWDTENNANVKAEFGEHLKSSDLCRFYTITEEGVTIYAGDDLEKALRIARTAIPEVE